MEPNKKEIDLFANMTAIDKLIVYCAQNTHPSINHNYLALLLENPINWNDLLIKAARHRVSSYVYHALKKSSNNLVPQDFLEKTKNLYLIEFSRTLVIQPELIKILQELKREKIQNILLKGPFLAEKIYLRSDLRSYSDVDILVQKKDLSRCEDVLTKLGYNKVEKNWKLSQEEGRTQLNFESPNVLIDLHWELLNNKWYPDVTRYFRDNIWKNAYPIKFHNSTTWALSGEDLLIYQCIHLSVHHNFCKLIWFKDVDQVLQSHKINWELFLNKTKDYCLATYCYYALYFTKLLLKTPVPEFILNELHPHFLTAKLFEFFLKRENLLDISENRRGKSQQIWMLLRDDFRGRLRAFSWRIFPDVEWYLQYYPFLPRFRKEYYYFLYPFLLLLRVVRRPIDQLKSESEAS